LVAQALGEPAQAWLRYDREAVMAGQFWRLLTAHIVHMSGAHLMLNCVALALIASLLGKQQRAPDWRLTTLGAAVAVSVGLLWRNPYVHWYVGLSGVVHGLFAAGCFALLRRCPSAALLTLATLACKLVWEQSHPGPASRDALLGGAVIVEAHLYGVIGGLVCSLAIHGRHLCRSIRRHVCRGIRRHAGRGRRLA